MDKQLEKAIIRFWSDLRDISTNELYEEYLECCAKDDVKPREKSVIVREACKETGCRIKEKRIVKTEKFFVADD